MSPPVNVTVELSGTTAASAASTNWISATPIGPLRRSIGLNADAAAVTVKSSEFPSDFDVLKPFRLRLTFGADVITLGGYELVENAAGPLGVELDASGSPTARTRELRLRTVVGSIREGRGNLLTVGTVNKLGRNNLVDTSDPAYLSYQALATLCLNAIGLGGTAPAAMNLAADGVTTLTAPGPLDWGNERALPNLEDLVSQIGWAATLKNDGSAIRLDRLRRAGETITLPASLTAAAEPYELSTVRPTRSKKIIVTSGRTRATTLASRYLSSLEWVGYDDRTGEWLNQAEWAAAYPNSSAAGWRPSDEVLPGSIASFNAGPNGPDADSNASDYRRAFGRIFTALRLKGTDLTRASRFVTIRDINTTDTGLPFTSGPAQLFTYGARPTAGGQFQNEPIDDQADFISLPGVAAISGAGVFKLPPDLAYVRIAPGPLGTHADAVAIAGTDLIIDFAHESNTGTHQTDYYVAGFEITNNAGVLSASKMGATALNTALADPNVVKVEAPFLRLIRREVSGGALVTLNGSELDAIAEQLAIMRGADETAQAGVIECRGLVDLEPGDASGAISAVTWDWRTGRTFFEINQHEVPQSEFDQLANRARRSVAAGLGRFSNPGSGVGLREVRTATTPGESAALSGGRGGAEPETTNARRGRERSAAIEVVDSPSELADSSAPRGEQFGMIFARITSATKPDADVPRWEYDWEQVTVNEDADLTASGLTSATAGKAYNLRESDNAASGVQGNGVSMDTLPNGFDFKSLEGAVVPLWGPLRFNSGTPKQIWLTVASYAVDGSCVAEAT